MILTGPKIAEECATGRITISPFSANQVNPNSYDFRLGPKILGYDEDVLDVRRNNRTWTQTLDETGCVLQPGRIYLGHTLEVMGSTEYVPIIRAKSSIARLGLFVHVTADLIDIGSINQWTLQLYPVNPIRVYPNMLIGQVTFWTVQGEIRLYQGKYQGSRGPQPSKVYMDFQRAVEQASAGDGE